VFFDLREGNYSTNIVVTKIKSCGNQKQGLHIFLFLKYSKWKFKEFSMQEYKKFMGIDPGKSGAISIVGANRQIYILERFKSFWRIGEIIRTYQPELAFCVLERNDGWGKKDSHWGARSNNTFLKNSGGYEALLEVYSIPYQLVTPRLWQGSTGCRVMKGECTKKKSIEIASSYYGLGPRVLNEHTADALNIALKAIQIYSSKDYSRGPGER
jgi:hypothetical protein